ncbi:MAG: hypothetical protein R3C32_00530 [Chloroflexota bacterium]
MLLTDIDGGWYTHLRTRGEDGGQVCHFVATRRGVAYEVLKGSGPSRAGLLDPLSRRRFEVDLPADVGFTSARLATQTGCCGCSSDAWDGTTSATSRRTTGGRRPLALPHRRLAAVRRCEGQKAHHHPQVVLDRRWLLITAGDPETRTNQLFLLDIADLPATRGVPLPPARRRRARRRAATRLRSLAWEPRLRGRASAAHLRIDGAESAYI